MAWLVNHDHETDTHVIPFQDLKEHTVDQKCNCSPAIKKLDGVVLVIHNSYDNREALEAKLDSLVQSKPGLNL